MQKSFKDCCQNFKLKKIIDTTDMNLATIYDTINMIDLLDKYWDYIISKEIHPNDLYIFIPSIEQQNNNIAFQNMAANIIWSSICENPHSINLIKKHWNRFNREDINYLNIQQYLLFSTDACNPHLKWNYLCKNPNPDVIPLIDDYLERHPEFLNIQNEDINDISQNNIYLPSLFRNENAAHLFIKYENQILEFINKYKINNRYWDELARNKNAIPFIDKHWNILKNKLQFCILCKNINAIPLIEKYWADFEIKINMNNKLSTLILYNLYKNPNAIPLIEKQWETYLLQRNINWTALCLNPNAIPLLKKKADLFINVNRQHPIKTLCENPNALDFIEEYWEQLISTNNICWESLCINTNPNVFKLIDKHFDLFITNYIYKPALRWINLCSVSSIVMIIEKHWERFITLNPMLSNMEWENLCLNPDAISLIDTHWDWFIANNYINWEYLCQNPNAFPLLEKHWDIFSPHLNTARWINIYNMKHIFEDEYIAVCKSYFREKVTEELMQVVWHPRNIHRFHYLLDNEFNWLE